MIAGVSWNWWLGFHAVVALLLVADSLLPDWRKARQRSKVAAWLWTAMLVELAVGFAGWITLARGSQAGLEFLASYAIEASLSVDNLIIFLLIFRSFGTNSEEQHKALQWGVGGAVVLRAAFIALGITLLQHFSWIPYLFGLLLLFAAWRLLRGASSNAAPGWIRRLQPANGSLLPVILAVEVTDILFAMDSIPAVLAVSHDPWIVYTSNIAAIVGLRAFYFALASVLDRLRYLHYGLGALLAFIAVKMLASHWIKIPVTQSLAVMGAILAITAVASYFAPAKAEN